MRTEEGDCLTPGTVMAVLDGEMGRRERKVAIRHLRGCARCRALADELASVSELAGEFARCLDDELLATYVDFRAGRLVREADAAKMAEVRQHLGECRRCREEGKAQAPTLRWAPVVATAALIALLLPSRVVNPPPKERPQPAPVVTSADPNYAPRTEASPRPVAPPLAASRAGQVAPRRPMAEGGKREWITPPRGSFPPSQTALVPAEEGAADDFARAAARLRQATKRGDAAGEAAAAMDLAGIYHQRRDYQRAGDLYRKAAEAAERARQPKVRVDALSLQGAVLAEEGRPAEARETLQQALVIAQQTQYRAAEENAQAQLDLLSDEIRGGK